MLVRNPIIENYFGLIQNLNKNAKLELISRISNSMSDKKETKQDQLLSCFGAFISEKSADEIINSIYESRYFTEKKIEL